jgi:rfaE bifunctional protein nucleotidyltransferase chain/domain
MIVFTNGCFDILHRGHIEYLKESKKLGTFLIVGINSDDSVRRLKGVTRPINNQWDRKAILEELRCVDEVIIFDEDTPYELIKKIAPDIITKGGDYKVEEVVGHDLAHTVIIPFREGYSTTQLIGKI